MDVNSSQPHQDRYHRYPSLNIYCRIWPETLGQEKYIRCVHCLCLWFSAVSRCFTDLVPRFRWTGASRSEDSFHRGRTWALPFADAPVHESLPFNIALTETCRKACKKRLVESVWYCLRVERNRLLRLRANMGPEIESFIGFKLWLEMTLINST